MAQILRYCTYLSAGLLLAMLVTACSSSSSSNQTAISTASPTIYYAHTIAFRNNTAMTWGYNGQGQLGIGNTTSQNVPVAVPTVTGVQGGAVGGTHTLVFRNMSGNNVYAWGNNAFGQLGDSTTTASPLPLKVPGIRNISSVAAGGNHSLALSQSAGGTLWAWGQNIYGQLGNGDHAGLNELAPVPVNDAASGAPLKGVTAIAAGGNHSLALTSGGNVLAWGYNAYGQLGQQGQNRTANTYTPFLVMSNSTSLLAGVTMIAAGGSHNVVLKDDHTIWTWGYNGLGQLGTDPKDTIDPATGNSFSTIPIKVVGIPLGEITAIAAGLDHTLALLTADGTVWAWGFNGYGQLGNNTSTDSVTPGKVQFLGTDGKPAGDLKGIKRIFASGHHNYAVDEHGTVWAWGDNTSLQLGIGANSTTFSTVAVKMPTNFVLTP